jgi:hypothetical protein
MMMSFLFRSAGLIIVTEFRYTIFPEHGIIPTVMKLKLLLADNCAKKSSLVKVK